jgi:hypothetical protein
MEWTLFKKNSIFVIKKCRIVTFARNWNILHRKWSLSRQKWQLKCFMDNGMVKTLHLYKCGFVHSRTSRFYQILWNCIIFWFPNYLNKDTFQRISTLCSGQPGSESIMRKKWLQCKPITSIICYCQCFVYQLHFFCYFKNYLKINPRIKPVNFLVFLCHNIYIYICSKMGGNFFYLEVKGISDLKKNYIQK